MFASRGVVEHLLRGVHAGLQAERLGELPLGLGQAPELQQRVAQVVVRLRKIGIQPDRLLIVGDRLQLAAGQPGQLDPEADVGIGIGGIDAQRLLVLIPASCPLPHGTIILGPVEQDFFYKT